MGDGNKALRAIVDLVETVDTAKAMMLLGSIYLASALLCYLLVEAAKIWFLDPIFVMSGRSKKPWWWTALLGGLSAVVGLCLGSAFGEVHAGDWFVTGLAGFAGGLSLSTGMAVHQRVIAWAAARREGQQ